MQNSGIVPALIHVHETFGFEQARQLLYGQMTYLGTDACGNVSSCTQVVTITDDEALGHRLKRVDRRYGDMHAVIWDRVDDRMDAAADPRGIGCAAIGQESPVCASAD